MRYGVIAAETVRRLTPMPALIDALAAAFADPPLAPPRSHHAIGGPGGAEGALLVMPAWRPGGRMGVKLVTVLPWLGAAGRPAVGGSYLLSDTTTGEGLAVLDGAELTR